MHVFTAYVRKLIADRAREEYSALVESTGNSHLPDGSAHSDSLDAC